LHDVCQFVCEQVVALRRVQCVLAGAEDDVLTGSERSRSHRATCLGSGPVGVQPHAPEVQAR